MIERQIQLCTLTTIIIYDPCWNVTENQEPTELATLSFMILLFENRRRTYRLYILHPLPLSWFSFEISSLFIARLQITLIHQFRDSALCQQSNKRNAHDVCVWHGPYGMHPMNLKYEVWMMHWRCVLTCWNFVQHWKHPVGEQKSGIAKHYVLKPTNWIHIWIEHDMNWFYSKGKSFHLEHIFRINCHVGLAMEEWNPSYE